MAIPSYSVKTSRLVRNMLDIITPQAVDVEHRGVELSSQLRPTLRQPPERLTGVTARVAFGAI